MSDSEKRFELNVLTNAWLKYRYQNFIERSIETISSLSSAYRKENDDLRIDAFYYNSPSLNAFVDKEGNKYLLGISIATLPLVAILFDKLLGFSFLMPELTAATDAHSYEIPFALDVEKEELNTRFDIQLSDERVLLSSLLSDLCVDFILLHEVGHIACGHVEGNLNLTGENSLYEFMSYRKSGSLLRSWEYEADVIASMLIVQRLNTVAVLSQRENHWRQLFSFCRNESELRCRLVGLLNASLFALFVYMNRLCLEFGHENFHPSPLVRVFYIKDFVARRAERDWKIDIALVLKFQDEYLEQFLQALEKMSAFDCEQITDDFEERLESSKKSLQRSFKRYRGYCEEWSWIPTQAWS